MQINLGSLYMPDNLKPFMPLIYRLYVNYGEQEYPLCKQERVRIDEKIILDYVVDYVMRIQSRSRS